MFNLGIWQCRFCEEIFENLSDNVKNFGKCPICHRNWALIRYDPLNPEGVKHAKKDLL